MKKIAILLIVSALFYSGCDLAEPQKKGQRNKPVPQEEVPAENPAPDPQGQNAPPKEETELVKAEVGAGAQGHYGDTGGQSAMDIITVPLSAYFRSKEKIVFNQITSGLNLYKAENDGKGPASHDEFMEKIIKVNDIKLPKLPQGQEYFYDSEDGELKVRKPK